MVMTYRRTKVKGRSYLMCAVCQRPLMKGYKVCYLVNEPGNTPPDPKSKQSLCGPHYIEQFVATYGFEPEGAIPDNLLQVENVVSFEDELYSLSEFQRGSGVGALMDLNPAVLEQALDAAKAGDWAESVMAVYVRMQTEQDLDLNEPITMPTDAPAYPTPTPPPSVQTLEEQIASKTTELEAMRERIALREQDEQEKTALRERLAEELGCEPGEVESILKQRLT